MPIFVRIKYKNLNIKNKKIILFSWKLTVYTILEIQGRLRAQLSANQ